jgi:glyoxylase-like metal-dependent hydrolase (beta-lactamase superfamily II)
MDDASIGAIARLTTTTPNWDRDATRAVGAARACAIAVLIWALGAEVEYADLRGIELFQARPDLPDHPLRATNAIVRDLPSVKRIYEQEGHAIAHVSVDIESRGTVMAAVDLTFDVGRYEPRIPLC